ncbi:MAG: aspartate--tRNA ligase [Candidatus Bipolaricaulaceae bacterium]
MKREGCGELRGQDVGRRVQLAGWVQRVRDLGKLTFLDLRDASGVVQLVCRGLGEARDLSREDTVRVVGTVARREAANPELPTGEVEVLVDELEILSAARPLPFAVDEDVPHANEETRLRFRYLDLRRPRMQRNLRIRHRLTMATRTYLDRQGFLEVETPMLTRSTPEGARDFLVPARGEAGKFYALPQSPQLFKQLLMASGVERYFQIVRCFRDEDLRADRQPEFTQLDLEMAFLQGPEELFAVVEGLTAHVFREVLGVELEAPFPRLAYRQALDRYGSDKPDLRFQLPLVELTDVFGDSPFRIFSRVAQAGGRIKALRVPGGARFTRQELAELEEVAVAHGAPGLVWLALEESGPRGPLARFLEGDALAAVQSRTEARAGDLLLFAAGESDRTAVALGQVRLQLARKLDLIPADRWCPLWVVDFPLFKRSDAGELESEHHPFTSPRGDDLPLLDEAPLQVRADSYDLVLNGVELASGSIRIHRRDLQERVFRVLGISPAEAERRFGFFLRALDYGAPPHGGIAFGLDRWAMMLAGENTLREVIAFPKTTAGACPLTGAPAEVDEAQLRQLHLWVTE